MRAALLIALLVVASGFTQAAAKDPPARGKPAVKVSDGTLTVDGTPVSFPAERKAIFDLFGQPSRTEKLANTIYVWDDLGLFAYEKRGDDRVFQLSVAVRDLSATGWTFWPARPFAGSVEIEGVAVTAATTPAGLNKGAKGELFKKGDVGEGTWKLDGTKLRVWVSLYDARGASYDKSGTVGEIDLFAPEK